MKHFLGLFFKFNSEANLAGLELVSIPFLFTPVFFFFLVLLCLNCFYVVNVFFLKWLFEMKYLIFRATFPGCT